VSLAAAAGLRSVRPQEVHQVPNGVLLLPNEHARALAGVQGGAPGDSKDLTQVLLLICPQNGILWLSIAKRALELETSSLEIPEISMISLGR